MIHYKNNIEIYYFYKHYLKYQYVLKKIKCVYTYY